jgi:putative oxidoreductase
MAWAVTIFEIAGGAALAAGFFVPVLAVVFAAELVAGIVLVHFREGWFTVGAGRNGMEFSVVLIAAFLAVAFSHLGKGKR